MPDTAVVWFRRDLRVHDLPALAHACREHERVVPLFVLDPALLRRALPLAGRARRSCSGCLRGARRRAARARRRAWSSATGARRPRCAAVAARGRRRRRARLRRRHGLRAARATRASSEALGRDGVRAHPPPGPLRRRRAGGPRPPPAGPTRSSRRSCARGRPRSAGRRARAARDRACRAIAAGRLPSLRALGLDGRAPGSTTAPSPARRPRGARRARWRRRAGLARYAERRDEPGRAAPRACRPTCASAASRRASSSARSRRGGDGAARYRDQLAWRDFYAHGAAALSRTSRASSSRSATAALEWDDRRRAARGVARGPDRLPGRRRRDAPARRRPAGCTTARA